MLTLNFTSFPCLTTERLVLRNCKLSDANALYAMRIDESVMQYIHRPRPRSIADVEELLNMMIENNLANRSFAWAIAFKEKPEEMIGTIGYYRTDFENFRAEIGYMLAPAHWRKGIVSEALVETIRFGFEEMKLHSIFANIDPRNEPSRQILLKHRFEKEALFKENFYFNDVFLDSEIYGLLAKNHGTK